jgi:glycosyltransferase involved in cell wall biosynthesis
MKLKPFVVAFDDIALQLGNTGIARYWRELISNLDQLAILQEEKVKAVFLCRTTYPTPSNFKRVEFPAFDFRYPAGDRKLISAFCKSERVDLFVSSYYTFSTNSANLVLVYDLIPEEFGFGRMNRGWMERELAIQAASSYFTISQNSRKDLIKFYPHTRDFHIGVGYPGVNSQLLLSEQPSFSKEKNQDSRYFVCIGSRYGEGGYKNGKLLTDALNLIDSREINFELYFIGGEPLTAEELNVQKKKGIRIHAGRLEDSELAKVLGGATALIYPSKYEGFGLPPLEALAVGVPVITTKSASIPEAVGNLALFIDADNASELANLLQGYDFNNLRDILRYLGPRHTSKFSWENTAHEFGKTLSQALAGANDFSWKKKQEILSEYTQIAHHLQH